MPVVKWVGSTVVGEGARGEEADPVQLAILRQVTTHWGGDLVADLVGYMSS